MSGDIQRCDDCRRFEDDDAALAYVRSIGITVLRHTCDEDCEPYLDDDACSVCGVVRTDPCQDCGRYSYHVDGCKSSDATGPIVEFNRL